MNLLPTIAIVLSAFVVLYATHRFFGDRADARRHETKLTAEVVAKFETHRVEFSEFKEFLLARETRNAAALAEAIKQFREVVNFSHAGNQDKAAALLQSMNRHTR